jgi:hypothetical protein
MSRGRLCNDGLAKLAQVLGVPCGADGESHEGLAAQDLRDLRLKVI